MSRDVLRMGVVLALGWGWVGGIAFLVALRLEEVFGLDAGARGLVLTAAGVVGLLSAPLVGRGVDRIGPRRTLLLGVGLGALVVAGVGLAPVVWLVAVVWALGGLAGQLVVVGTNSLVLGSRRANTGGATSVVQAVRFGGTAVAPIAFTPIYHADPLTAFLAPAVTIAVVAPLALPRSFDQPRSSDQPRSIDQPRSFDEPRDPA
jgi:MFS family permease